MKIFFRCDASKKIGGGHASRCITLANELQNAGSECLFICNEEAADVYPALKSFNLLPTSIAPQQCDALIVDNYDLGSTYENSWRNHTKKIVAIDDIANRKHDCDILLDQTFMQKADLYQDLVPENCKLLLGSDYALLKPDFARLRHSSLNRRTGSVNNILVTYGSVDIHNLYPLTLKALKSIPKPLKVEIICESAHKELNAMKNLAQASHHNINFHYNVNNMAEFMMNADLAIGAVGTTSWERATLALPTIAIQVADNQSMIMKNLEKQGAIFNLGLAENLQEKDITKQINTLLDNPEKLMMCSEKSAQVTDGKGADKVAKIILEEISNG